MNSARPGEGTGAGRSGDQDQRIEQRPQVPAELAPEYALVGALLALDLSGARAALARIDDTDLGDYRLRIILTAARRMVADGQRPDAVLLLQRLQTDGTVSRSTELGDYGQLVHDLVRAMPTPAFWAYYAKATIEAAAWRRYGEMLTRLNQAADRGSLDRVLDLADREVAAVRAVAARRTPAPASLRAVP